MSYSVIVSYDEIGLKTWNIRKTLVIALAGNIKIALKSWGYTDFKIRNEWDKLFIDTDNFDEAFKITLIVRNVFGVANVTPAKKIDISGLKKTGMVNQIIDHATGFVFPGDSFLVDVRFKADDQASLNKDELIRALIKLLEERIPGSKGTTSGFTRELNVFFRKNECYCYGFKHEGPGGFPFGSNGKAACLISGGLDSPVASWLMMKRGMHPIFVHCKINDKNAELTASKVRKLVDTWCYTNNKIKYYEVPYDSVLQSIKSSGIDNRFTCIFCKRLMLRIAEMIAKKENAQAIVTGDSLGQVASQTSWNLSTIDQAVTLPVYRPLIGMDKKEIVELGRKIGPAGEITSAACCEYLPGSPAIKSELEDLAIEIKQLNINQIIEEAVERAEIQQLTVF